MNPTPSTPRRRSGKRMALAGGIVAALAAAGWYGWQHYHAQEDALSRYLIASVQQGDIEDLVTATGSLQPSDYVDVGAQVSGQLEKIYAEVGSVVKKGDLLAEIDSTVYRATVDARRAALKNLQATLLARQSDLQLAEQQLQRQQNLARDSATSDDSLQQAQASLRSARAQVASVQAQIEQAESTLRVDETSLKYSQILAPMDGVVVSISLKQGQTINASQSSPTLLRIADLSTMTVQTQVSEADVTRLRPGMPVYFTTLGSRNRRYQGELRKVEPTPTVNNNVVLYNALFDVKNQQRNLLPQMTAQVFFVAAEAHDTLVVPAGAVKLARMAPGSRRGQPEASGAAGEAPRGEASAGKGQLPQAGAAVPGKEGKAAANHQAAKRQVLPANAAMDAAGMLPPAGERPAGFGGAPLSDAEREARRKQFESMTPAQREAWRARRAEQRQAQGEGGMPPAGARGGAALQAAAANPGKTDKAGKAANPAADAARVKPRALPVWSGVGSGGRQQRVREGTVRVVLPDNSIVERKVTVGITDRVSYQVLGGLKPGERVIVGEKAQDKEAARKNSNRNADMGPPAGMGAPGMGAGR
ncbi:efflux RND transporter periplasmic adaptor subunit [Vogesella sp. DC21W]|uniref:Efflux RND transporter periplasmic adaptor subunit n=1 Tax=Vogesella aquatica TaxID=2984206 RepID=A0ABT5IZD8_9NEIS|nr:efflux RND transporter periplasmic adaptor subunit [Vogesella aquatica]MDC7717929.1 efflux RND transporter periplasmic adaptor subunit [Vogesella aquatica]